MDFKYETNLKLDEAEYYKPFLELRSEVKVKGELALERAWKNRDFEIDKYWSRATYFWAFIAASFGGYFLVSNSSSTNSKIPELPFIIASLGLVFSAAWYFVNQGSKKWQENWEKHIDLLEDSVTGPLYKTVLNDKGFSVSKINLIVSRFVLFIWVLLWMKSIVPWEADRVFWEFSIWKLLIALIVIATVIEMTTKHDKQTETRQGLSSFRRRKVVFVKEGEQVNH